MPRILIVWELGSGFGHLAALKPLADAFSSLSHQVVLAVKSPELQAGDGGYRVRSIDPPVRIHRGAGTYTLADILHDYGFADQVALRARLRMWREVLDAERPDFLVADFSPWLLAAACGRIPAAVLGNWFSVPPPGSRLPHLRPWMKREPPPESLQREQRILRMLSRAQQEPGIVPPFSLPDLLRGDCRFVRGLPEFDPYHPLRAEKVRLVGPPAETEVLPRRNLFVYLRSRYPPFRGILETVRAMGLTAAVYAPGLNWEQMGSDFDGVEILDGPLALHTILHSFDAVAHHGGSLGHHCLAAGLPQVFFPWQLEQYAAMKPAAERGYGILVGRKAALRREVLQRAFRTALDRRSRESAKRKALEIADRQNYITPEALAGDIIAGLAGRSGD